MNDLLRDEGFWLAFTVASLGTGVALLLGHTGPRVGRGLGFAPVAASAVVYALLVEGAPSVGLLAGLLLVLAAAVARQRGAGLDVQGAAGALGAGMVALALPDVAGWMRAAAFAAVLVLGICGSVVDRRATRLLPVLLGVSAVGLYVCVPDTEIPLMLLGALVPTMAFAFDRVLTPSPATGVVLTLFVYAAVVGGAGRPGAVIGGIACVGAVALLPLAGWEPRSVRDVVTVVVTHGFLVLWVARVAGLRDSAWGALLLCLPAFAVAGLVLLVAARRSARTER